MTPSRSPMPASTAPCRRRLRWLAVAAALVVVLLLLAVVPREQAGPGDTATRQDLPAGPPWTHGAARARFVLVLYADLACPFCQSYVPQLQEWIGTQPDLQLQWHHLPLAMHEPVAGQQAVLAECAGRVGGQDAFWSAIRWAYAQPHANGQVPDLAAHVEASEALRACIDGGDAAAAVRSQAQEAMASGITATPSLRLIDQHSGQSMLLAGPLQGDALLSAIDMLASPGPDSDPQQER
ncbi:MULTISPECIES: DsbA family protein [Pseudomonadota]|uniref:DsbA family protein n=1 Tax=Pseudomonadota TaxID=1224 RepID=UPI001F0D3D06|nr:thioredoxin domain-containing protein [Achromobacter xylosoxidans]MCH4578102.1 DsbA family protein [Achromobacter xylosoxidans]